MSDVDSSLIKVIEKGFPFKASAEKDTLKDAILRFLEDESKAGPEYVQWADYADKIGKPEIAIELRKTAVDENRHYELMKYLRKRLG
jgi:rubrerythrin